jgi:uncharacterized membrane protein
MSEQDFGTTPPAAEPAATEASWGSTQPPYTAPGYTATPPSQLPQPAVAQGLSESTASALAYITIIPAIIFLLVAPYNQSPKIKFHAIQEIGLSIVGFVLGFFLIIPILGWIIWLVGGLCLLVVWIMCIVKASQGSAFKIPGISNFAAQQSGYVI